MAPTLKALRQMTDEELVAQYDEFAERTGVGLNFYLEELRRREQAAATSTMVGLTWAIFGLTLVVTVATIVNVIIAIT